MSDEDDPLESDFEEDTPDNGASESSPDTPISPQRPEGLAAIKSDLDEEDDSGGEDVDAIPKLKRVKKSSKRAKKNEFIDDEAELSSDGGDVSEDELESDDDDRIDTELVDLDAKELGSDEEEEIRRLYHKQIETEDRRTLLLLQEQLEENEIAGGQRRRKFKWQTKELMENSLRRHYDPDDDDSQDLDDEDDIDYSEINPRLRRPTAESILIGSTRVVTASNKRLMFEEEQSLSGDSSRAFSKSNRLVDEPVAGPSNAMGDESNSNVLNTRLVSGTNKATSDLNRFVFRDKELVAALSCKDTIVTTREEREHVVQREIRRVLQSKSIFDQLYS